MSPPEPAVLIATFLAGLFGSGHCFAMCGGIAGSLGALAARPAGRGGFAAALQFNLGRLIGYTALGAAAGAMLGLAGDVGRVPAWGLWLRGFAALLILGLGLHYLFNWGGLSAIERTGGRVWRTIAPIATRATRRDDSAGRLLLGACWGLLPCGLVYTVLLTAASTGGALAGGTTMLTFGIGTLPSMLGLTMAAPSLAGLLADRALRRFIGFSLVLLAAWMAFTIWPVSGANPHAH